MKEAELREMMEQTKDALMVDKGMVTKVMFATIDPTIEFDRSSVGKPAGSVPAMTTLLHRVCDNDPKKFEEATRLVELFIYKAWEEVGLG